MKDGVRVVNVARGKLVVEDDAARGARLGQGRRRRARRLPRGARHRPPAVRLPQRRRHPAPRRLHRGGHRPRRLPGRRAGGGGADRRRGHERGERARHRRRGPRGARARSCRWPPTSAGSRVALAEGTSVDALEIEYRGRIAERDTRLLTVQVLKGALAGHTEEEVNDVNAPAIAEERGIAVSQTSSSHARDFTDLVRVTVRQRRHRDARGRHDARLRCTARTCWRPGARASTSSSRSTWRSSATRTAPACSAGSGPMLGEAGINIISAAVGRRPRRTTRAGR